MIHEASVLSLSVTEKPVDLHHARCKFNYMDSNVKEQVMVLRTKLSEYRTGQKE